MKIKYFGHASFLITSDEGVNIITDPYIVGRGISYAPIKGSADIVTISHEHGDHNDASAIKGNPQVLRGEGLSKVKGIEFKGIASYHDAANGSQRGSNTIFCFSIDGISICHLGDLGHLLSEKQVASIGTVDVLLAPVGGYFTIEASQISTISQSLKAKVIIPMHYKTAKCGLPIAGVDEFLKDKGNVRKLNSSEVEYKKSKLSEKSEIVVLQPAL